MTTFTLKNNYFDSITNILDENDLNVKIDIFKKARNYYIGDCISVFKVSEDGQEEFLDALYLQEARYGVKLVTEWISFSTLDKCFYLIQTHSEIGSPILYKIDTLFLIRSDNRLDNMVLLVDGIHSAIPYPSNLIDNLYEFKKEIPEGYVISSLSNLESYIRPIVDRRLFTLRNVKQAYLKFQEQLGYSPAVFLKFNSLFSDEHLNREHASLCVSVSFAPMNYGVFTHVFNMKTEEEVESYILSLDLPLDQLELYRENQFLIIEEPKGIVQFGFLANLNPLSNNSDLDNAISTFQSRLLEKFPIYLNWVKRDIESIQNDSIYSYIQIA